MTTSDSWGYPLLGPRPDLYGYSIYRYIYDDGYRLTHYRPWMFRLRAFIIRITQFRKSFIHELQAEPWGPEAMMDMTLEEQFKSINPPRVKEAIAFAKKTKLSPVDVWGLEWWYWLKKEHNNTEIWDYMRSVYKF